MSGAGLLIGLHALLVFAVWLLIATAPPWSTEPGQFWIVVYLLDPILWLVHALPIDLPDSFAFEILLSLIFGSIQWGMVGAVVGAAIGQFGRMLKPARYGPAI